MFANVALLRLTVVDTGEYPIIAMKYTRISY